MTQPPTFTARQIREETAQQIQNRLFAWCRLWNMELTDAQYVQALHDAQHSKASIFVAVRRNARRDAIKHLRATA